MVAGVGTYATVSYFSDTETSVGNTITAGSLDLTINGYNNPTFAVVEIEDMKPSQTWYSGPITLKVSNNPGKLYKHIMNDCGDIVCETVTITEPECTDQGGSWTEGTGCGSIPGGDENYLPAVTWFDLAVWVGPNDVPAVAGEGAICDATVTENCWETIIPDETITVDEIASQWIYLGTYGERMTENEIVIRQSFHMKATAENEYQSDMCTFKEEFKVLQTNAPHPTPAYIPDNLVLDSVDIGDVASETGHLVYPGDDWSFIGDPANTGTGYLP